MPNLINQILFDQYRVDAYVASGGMGAVYRVWDLKRNVLLAMKVLDSRLIDDPHMLQWFQEKANALKRLTPLNIVQFYALFHSPDMAFLLERFVEGPSTRRFIDE
jgi:serine/threonine-protein kinase